VKYLLHVLYSLLTQGVVAMYSVPHMNVEHLNAKSVLFVISMRMAQSYSSIIVSVMYVNKRHLKKCRTVAVCLSPE